MRHLRGNESKSSGHRSLARLVGGIAAISLIGLPAAAQITPPFDPTALELAWTAPLRNTLHSLPVVDGAAVYLTEGFLDHTAVHAFPLSCGTGGAVCERLWRGATGATPRSPVVADGVLYVVSGSYLNAPRLLAFPASCRSDGGWCDPLWRGLGSEELVVSEGIVFAGANSHEFEETFVGPRLYAYEVSCGTGGQTCQPLWFADLDGDPTAIVSEQGMILVTAGRTLYAFPTACDVVNGRCEPAWTAVVPGYLGELVVKDGFAYVVGKTGVFAFPTPCRTDGATCAPEWIGATRRPVHFGDLAVGDRLVYLSKDQNRLLAFGVGCGSDGATCRPVWKAGRDLGTWLSTADPVASDGMVIVGGPQLFAFESTCGSGGAACAPAWVSRPPNRFHLSSPKTIADGFVLVGLGRRLLAFPLHCGTEGEICPRIWSAPAGLSEFWPPVVADGSVYYASDRLYAFQPQT